MTAALTDVGPLWLVGCGNMGGALLSRWLDGGLNASAVTVIDPAASHDRVRVVDAPPPDDPPQVAVLAVKPQLLDPVAATLGPRLGHATLLISILAGSSLATLRSRFPRRAIVRAMPNLPATVGRGVTALYADDLAAEDRAIATELMAAAGRVEWLDDEALFDAVTGVSGSGPAYVFRIVEALAAAGVAAGLPEALAARLARDTVVGAARMLEDDDVDPAALRARVTSPKGTTAAGLAALDRDDAIGRLIRDAVAAAAARSRELGG